MDLLTHAYKMRGPPDAVCFTDWFRNDCEAQEASLSKSGLDDERDTKYSCRDNSRIQNAMNLHCRLFFTEPSRSCVTTRLNPMHDDLPCLLAMHIALPPHLWSSKPSANPHPPKSHISFLSITSTGKCLWFWQLMHVKKNLQHATFFWSTALQILRDFGSKQGAEIREYVTLDRPQDTRWGITKKRKLFPSLKRRESRKRKRRRRKGGGEKEQRRES